ncbi:MAG: P-loop NTPase fold protein, partial [Flavobacteriaceae bacterium]|nr:P-loop NTPase fold protein [Flavobacteriaceae bacterium]
MDAKTKTYNFNILNEEVADEDFFEDQTHENIAETINTLINNSEKASTIGLEGDWGSGKSTVVEILRKKVDEKTLFFHFDAWAHEGDPLRRIFLESLINEIDECESDEVLQETKKKISLKTKTVEIKSSKLTSKLGAGLSVAAMLVPIGIALINFIEPESITFDITDELEPHWLAITSLSFICTPILYLIYWALCGDLNDEGKRDWSFFQSKSEDTYNQDIVEEGERTSVEFEEYFKNILGEYVGKGKKYERAIIVVDNLDRVSQEEFLKIWSTLQAFFQHRNSRQNHEYMEKTWFIVPFDRKGLELPLNRLSHKAPGLFAAETGEILVSNIDPLSNEKRVIAKSFIDKSFQIILDVPTPIMSGWDKYLTQYIEQSLSSWSSAEVAEASEMFKKYAAIECNQSPTPRLMRNYINQLGALRLRFSDDFRVKYLSAYAILKLDRDRSELQELLVNRQLPNNVIPFDNDEAYESLAGILYGVNRSKGKELLLAETIMEMVYKGKSQQVKELLNNYGSAFWIAWRAAWPSIKPDRDLADDAKYNRLKVFEEIFSSKDIQNDYLKSLEDSICKSTTKREYTKVNYPDMLFRLAKLVANPGRYYTWLKSFYITELQTSINNLAEGTTNGDLEKIEPLSHIRAFLIEKGIDLEKKHHQKLDFNGYRNWKEVLNEHEVDFDEILPSKELLISSARSLIRNRMLEKVFAEVALDLILKYSEFYQSDFDELLDVLSHWIYDPVIQNNNKESSLFGYKLLLAIYSHGSEEHKEKICKAVNDQRFIRVINQYYPQVDPGLLLLIQICLGDKLDTNNILRNEYKQKASLLKTHDSEEISEIISKYDFNDELWDLARYGYKFAADALTQKILNIEFNDYSKGMLYFDEIDCLSDNFPDNEIQNKLVDNFLQYNSLEDIEQQISSDPLSYDKVIYLLYDVEKEEIAAYCLKVVGGLSKDQWQDCFESNSYLLDVAFNSKWKASSNYVDAFEWFYKSIAQGDIETPHEWFFNHFSDLSSVI